MNQVATATVPTAKAAPPAHRYTPLTSPYASIKLDSLGNDGVYRISFKGLVENQPHKLMIKHLDLTETMTTLKRSEPKPRVVIIDLGNIACIGAEFIGALVDLQNRKINVYLLNPSDIARETLSVSTVPNSFNIREDEATVLSEIGPAT